MGETDAEAATLAAEVEVDHVPELLGEMEHLRAILWARLALRISRSTPTDEPPAGRRRLVLHVCRTVCEGEEV